MSELDEIYYDTVEKNKDNYSLLQYIPQNKISTSIEIGYTGKDNVIPMNLINNLPHTPDSCKQSAAIAFSDLKFKQNKKQPENVVTKIKGLKYKVVNNYFDDDVKHFTYEKNAINDNRSKGITTDFSNLSNSLNNNKFYETLNDGGHYFSIEWYGVCIPDQDGLWRFGINSDDASYLWIGDQAISQYSVDNALVNNGTPHGMKYVENGINLKKDQIYPIRIQFGERGGYRDFVLRIISPEKPNITNYYSVLYTMKEERNYMYYSLVELSPELSQQNLFNCYITDPNNKDTTDKISAIDFSKKNISDGDIEVVEIWSLIKNQEKFPSNPNTYLKFLGDGSHDYQQLNLYDSNNNPIYKIYDSKDTGIVDQGCFRFDPNKHYHYLQMFPVGNTITVRVVQFGDDWNATPVKLLYKGTMNDAVSNPKWVKEYKDSTSKPHSRMGLSYLACKWDDHWNYTLKYVPPGSDEKTFLISYDNASSENNTPEDLISQYPGNWGYVYNITNEYSGKFLKLSDTGGSVFGSYVQQPDNWQCICNINMFEASASTSQNPIKLYNRIHGAYGDPAIKLICKTSTFSTTGNNSVIVPPNNVITLSPNGNNWQVLDNSPYRPPSSDPNNISCKFKLYINEFGNLVLGYTRKKQQLINTNNGYKYTNDSNRFLYGITADERYNKMFYHEKSSNKGEFVPYNSNKLSDNGNFIYLGDSIPVPSNSKNRKVISIPNSKNEKEFCASKCRKDCDYFFISDGMQGKKSCVLGKNTTGNIYPLNYSEMNFIKVPNMGESSLYIKDKKLAPSDENIKIPVVNNQIITNEEYNSHNFHYDGVLQSNSKIGLESSAEYDDWGKRQYFLLYGHEKEGLTNKKGIDNIEPFDPYDSTICSINNPDPEGCLSNIENKKINPLIQLSNSYSDKLNRITKHNNEIQDKIQEYQDTRIDISNNPHYFFNSTDLSNKKSLVDGMNDDLNELMLQENNMYITGAITIFTLLISGIMIATR